MRALIVIPTYNEAKNIAILVEKILENYHNINIVIIDDNSPDNTAEVAKKLKSRYPHKIEIIGRKAKLGLGSAYITGFKHGIDLKYDLVFSMDADLSHDPSYIKNFIKKIEENCDVVLGSRYVSGGGVNWGIHRKILSKGANYLAKTILRLKVKDITTGFRCYKRIVLETIALDNIKSDGFSFLEEILYLCHKKGYKICETPIFFHERKKGRSKLSRREMVKFFFTLIRLRFKR